ncbi:hypothetical protein Tco_1540546 [Tanacetum coccineum]
MVDSQPMEEEFRGAVTKDMGTKTHRGPNEPVLQTQKIPSPSSAFIKENIDVLRTMIKEHDQQVKMKATPRKLAYADSDKEALASFEELSQKFLEEFSQQNRNAKDLIENQGIKRRQNEGLQAFMDWFQSESSHIKGVPMVLCISAFMHGHSHPKLTKKLNDKIPKTVDEMFKRVRAFIKGEVAAGSAVMVHPSQGNKWNIRPTWTGGPEKARNRGGPREAQRNIGGSQHQRLLSVKNQIEEAMASGKLAHPVKDIRQNNQWNVNQGRNNVKVINMIREGRNSKSPFKEERILVDGGSSLEIMYEHCFRDLNVNIWLRLRRCKAPMMEYSQIRMAEDYKEKTEFHMKEGVYCFTHIPKELKNSAATLQRMMENVLADQKGRNVEIYLEEVVIKNKSGQNLIQDVEETLRKLKRVNIKIDPITSSFRVKEGRFLGHMVTKEGIRAHPEKVQAIILSPTLKNSNQIQSLFLQLTTISKFIPKLIELKYPIREARMRFKTAKGSGWTNKAEEALRRIKSKLSKLQTLAIPKDGEVLMLCLRQRNETISSVLLVEREGIQIHVSYEAEGSVVKKLFGQGKQVEETPNANEEGMLNLSKKLQAKSTPTPRAWKFYLGLAASTNQGMRDLHVFIDSLTLVAQVLNHSPPKNPKPKSRNADRIGNYKFGLLNQEVSVGIKTRPSVEEASSSKKGKATSNVLGAKPNYNCKASGSN